MSHLVQLVDRYDTLLGYKLRDDLDDSDTWRIICIHITNSTGTRILLQKRSARKKQNPGLWTIAVAGTLEKDDNYDSCAYRELEEELLITGILLEDQ
jgi:8-oxo-dGTP pyrophosphatase MutT (NUDIX family)